MKKIFVILMIVCVSVVYAGSFVYKKEGGLEKKKISLSVLREQVCQGLYDLLQKVPLLLRGVSTVQEEALEVISDFIMSSKAGLLSKASVPHLEQMQKAIDECQAALMTAQQKMKQLQLICDCIKK